MLGCLLKTGILFVRPTCFARAGIVNRRSPKQPMAPSIGLKDVRLWYETRNRVKAIGQIPCRPFMHEECYLMLYAVVRIETIEERTGAEGDGGTVRAMPSIRTSVAVYTKVHRAGLTDTHITQLPRELSSWPDPRNSSCEPYNAYTMPGRPCHDQNSEMT
jgi:hypothetical protein